MPQARFHYRPRIRRYPFKIVFDDSERLIDPSHRISRRQRKRFFDIGERTPKPVMTVYTIRQCRCSETSRRGLATPAGFSIVSPSEAENAAWSIVLSPGQDLVDRDFALRPSSATGQSENSSVDGIAFLDNVRNGVYDAIGDTLLPNTVVFLDQAPFDGVWRNPERRTLTDAGGRYSFSGLGSQIVNVVAEIGTTATLISRKEAFSKSPPRSSSPPVLSRHNKPKPWCQPTSTAITSPI